ncbi:MAG: hypothetical protein E6I84_09390 [Chloroflexi bacterium]|nr:MAG: hypothetical protein E6J32_06825 [Chloroflexota bacterium]TMD65580.1 MAG: hypothetical protein E6I84_09390 [Chloroflexota bacterium]
MAVEAALGVIDRHFAAENAHDVEATLATYTEDIVWDDVTHPASPFQGKQAVGQAYGGILEAIPDLNLRSVLRFQCGEHVVDESILTGHVVGEFAGVRGGGAPVSFRLLHVFDLRNGLIARENAWFDSAAVVRQVERFRLSSDR